MRDALAAVAALDRQMLQAAADEVRELSFGHAALTPSLPRVRDANLIHVAGAAEIAGAAELLAASEEIYGAAPQLRHRKLSFEAAERRRSLAEELDTRGWALTPLSVLAHTGAAVAPSAAAGPVARADIRALDRQLALEQGLGDPVIDQLEELVRRRSEVLEIVAIAGRDERGEPVARADVYLGSDAALIEDVATLKRAQGAGIGAETMSAAIALADERGIDHVCAIAKPDVAEGFYAPLGFARVGGWLEAVLVDD
jgi:GNAT superfamily N-acetyltransferase